MSEPAFADQHGIAGAKRGAERNDDALWKAEQQAFPIKRRVADGLASKGNVRPVAIRR